jgi:hypothetical protein
VIRWSVLGARAALLGIILTAASCDARSSGGTVIPTDHGSDSQLTPEGDFEGETMGELSSRLDRLLANQDQLMAASSKDAGKCEELCELSRAICEVKTKMCEIADTRVFDDEYQNLCRQAKQRCQRASESCVRCVAHHERVNQLHRPGPGSCEGEPGRE